MKAEWRGGIVRPPGISFVTTCLGGEFGELLLCRLLEFVSIIFRNAFRLEVISGVTGIVWFLLTACSTKSVANTACAVRDNSPSSSDSESSPVCTRDAGERPPDDGPGVTCVTICGWAELGEMPTLFIREHMRSNFLDMSSIFSSLLTYEKLSKATSSNRDGFGFTYYEFER